MSACSMCMGTDCAGDCAWGQCYAEYMQELEAREQALIDAEYEDYMENGLRAAEAVEKMARAFA